MTLIVNVQEAKTRLSELLAKVEHGEDVVIARAGKPIAHLSPVAAAPERAFGIMALELPASFFQPLGEEELAAWE